MKKRIYKNREKKMLCGVCAGVAEYFDIDPTLVRVAWIIFCAMGGSGFLAYLVAALIIPEYPIC